MINIAELRPKEWDLLLDYSNKKPIMNELIQNKIRKTFDNSNYKEKETSLDTG